MRLRSFTAKTLPEAMARMRGALGPDAMILSTHDFGDGQGVRVTAALEDGPMDEFESARGINGAGSIDDISEALSFHRLPPGLFDQLIGGAVALGGADGTMALAGALDSEFTFAALPDESPASPIMLVGPPGAGKSASAAKLCARARLSGGRASLITMDTVKSGGLAQMSIFARSLEVPLEQADDPESLAEILDSRPDDGLVVIDTPGINPFDDGDLDFVALTARTAGAEPVLVLPAGGDAAEAAETAVGFAHAGVKLMIATRLDTARRLGGLLSAALGGQLALMAASFSPNVGDGLQAVNPVLLARLLLSNNTNPAQSTLATGTV
jgi:flagellar biosynthesis protein FlhF